MKILKGRQAKPRRVLLYGVEGVGKSTWAAGAPSPLFLDFESGLGDVDCAKTERLSSLGEVYEALRWLYASEHDYRSIVFDTVDWFEKLIFDQVCKNANQTNIEKVDGGYGKGYIAAANLLQEFLGKLEKLIDARRLNVVFLGHATREKVTDPEAPQYERHAPDLSKHSAAILREWCDEVFYASYRTFTRTEDAGFNKTRSIAIGGDERFIRTTHSAGVTAKNRLSLPAELPMSWAAYQQHWPTASVSPAGDIAGIVVNGSSKKEIVT